MSSRFWRNRLKKFLAKPENGKKSSRIAIIGVGNDLSADDGAGVEVVRLLRRFLPPSDRVLLIEGATAPENFSAPLRRFTPDFLLFVDAAEMGQKPGTIQFLEMKEINGFSASTHILPLTNLAAFIQSETGCDVAFLGIQPASLLFDTPLTLPIQKSVRRVADCMSALLQENFS